MAAKNACRFSKTLLVAFLTCHNVHSDSPNYRLWVVFLDLRPIGLITYVYLAIVHFYGMKLPIWTDPKLRKSIIQMDDISP